MVILPFLYYGLIPATSTQHDIAYLQWLAFINRERFTESDLQDLTGLGIWFMEFTKY